jgi:hypothetical protein
MSEKPTGVTSATYNMLATFKNALDACELAYQEVE